MDRRKWEKRKTGTAKKTTGALLLLTALLTGSMLLSGCSAWLMSEGLDGDEMRAGLIMKKRMMKDTPVAVRQLEETHPIRAVC